MLHKKPANKQPTDEDVIIERVDAMLDIKRPDGPPTLPGSSAGQEIDIFKDLKTAPPISTDLTESEKTDAPQKLDVTHEKPAPKILEHHHGVKVLVPEHKSSEKAVPLKPAESVNLDDKSTDQAVREIEVKESDEILVVEDILAQVRPPVTPPKKSFRSRLFG